jgi:hypothetical protein
MTDKLLVIKSQILKAHIISIRLVRDRRTVYDRIHLVTGLIYMNNDELLKTLEKL